MTPDEYRAAHPGTNSRFLAWCYATGRDPDARISYADGYEYMVWISESGREAGPEHGVLYGRIVDHEAFTEYLWRVAEREA